MASTRLLALQGTLALMLVSSVAFAAENFTVKPMQLAELIIGPERAPSRPSSAKIQRDRAGGYQKDSPVNSENDDVGILAPRGGAPADERAFDNRIKARAYQQGGDNAAPLPLPTAGSFGYDGSQLRGGESRNKAKAYASTGNGQDIDLSHVGRDGIPLVPCHDADNVSGRIGDDTLAGSLIFIVRNGQQIKVRCR